MATLAIVLAAGGATRSWALLGLENISYDGSLEVSGNSADNETDFSAKNDHRGVTATRVRIGMNAQVTEGVMGRLEADRTPGSAGSAALYGGAGKPTSLNAEQSNFVLHNAYAQLEDLWGFRVRLGRQYVGEAGDLVWHIGPKSDDNLTINSIDGLEVECKKSDKMENFWDRLHLVFFTGKFKETAGSPAVTDATSSGDINLTDIEAILHIIPGGGRVRFAVMRGDASNTPAVSDNNHLGIWRLGANGGVLDNMVTYRAEFLQNFGQQNGVTTAHKYKGNALDLGAGYNSPETPAGTFGAWLNYVRASGDDNSTDSDDKSFQDFSSLGINTSDRYYGEILGKSNALGLGQGLASPLAQGVGAQGLENQGLQILNIGAQYKPVFWQKGWARLDFYTAKLAKDSIDGVSIQNKIGTEWDLTVGYNHTDNVTLEGGYAALTPKEALTGGGNAPNETVTKLFARAKIKWGGEEK